MHGTSFQNNSHLSKYILFFLSLTFFCFPVVISARCFLFIPVSLPLSGSVFCPHPSIWAEVEAWTVLGSFLQSSLLYVFCVGFLWCNRKWLLAETEQSATQRGRTCCHSGLFTGKLLHGLVAMARRPGSRGVTSVWNHAFQLHCLIVQDSRGPWDVPPAEEPNGQLPAQHSELQLIEELIEWTVCLYEKQER